MKYALLAAVAALPLAIASAAQAALIGYEPFDYPDGTSIVGQSGGTGWSYNGQGPGQWYGIDNGNGGSYDPKVFNSQLVTGEGNRNAAKRSIGDQARATGTFYFAADIDFDPGTRFVGLSWYDFGTEREFFGVGFDRGVFGVSGVTGDIYSTLPALPNTTYHLVARLDYNNNNIALWVNPTSGDENNPLVSSPLNANNWFTDIRLASGGGDNTVSARWDNLTLATDFASVVPAAVPEPSAVLLTLPLATLTLRRKR